MGSDIAQRNMMASATGPIGASWGTINNPGLDSPAARRFRKWSSIVLRSCEIRTRLAVAARSRTSESRIPSRRDSAAEAKSIAGSCRRTPFTMAKSRSESARKRILKRGTHSFWPWPVESFPTGLDWPAPAALRKLRIRAWCLRGTCR